MRIGVTGPRREGPACGNCARRRDAGKNALSARRSKRVGVRRALRSPLLPPAHYGETARRWSGTMMFLGSRPSSAMRMSVRAAAGSTSRRRSVLSGSAAEVAHVDLTIRMPGVDFAGCALGRAQCAHEAGSRRPLSRGRTPPLGCKLVEERPIFATQRKRGYINWMDASCITLVEPRKSPYSSIYGLS